MCGGQAITGEGPDAPCRACLMRIVDGVRDPLRLSAMERTVLLEAHSENVFLIGHMGRMKWGRRDAR